MLKYIFRKGYLFMIYEDDDLDLYEIGLNQGIGLMLDKIKQSPQDMDSAHIIQLIVDILYNDNYKSPISDLEFIFKLDSEYLTRVVCDTLSDKFKIKDIDDFSVYMSALLFPLKPQIKEQIKNKIKDSINVLYTNVSYYQKKSTITKFNKLVLSAASDDMLELVENGLLPIVNKTKLIQFINKKLKPDLKERLVSLVNGLSSLSDDTTVLKMCIHYLEQNKKSEFTMALI